MVEHSYTLLSCVHKQTQVIPFCNFSHIQLKMSLKQYYVLLPLLFLSQLVLRSAQQSKRHPDCPFFPCGSLREVGFPFSNTSNPKCGVFVLNCTGTEPKVRFHEKGKWYHVDSFNYFNWGTIKIRDPEVQNHLESNRCDLLDNFTEKVPPFVFINITETRTFFKCKPESTPFYPPNFFVLFGNYILCKDYELYFNASHQGILPSLPETLSKRCSVVQSSRLDGFDTSLTINSQRLLEDVDFTLNWKVSPDCWECYFKGGECRQNQPFECGNLKGGSSTGKKVAIGTGTGIGGVLLTCVIFLLYQRHKRNKLSSSSTLISRDISNDLSLTQDPEKGNIYFQTPIFTYKQLDEATNHFDSSKELGDGGFGTVYHGKLRDGRVVAVKRLFEHNYKRVEQFMNEIEILSRLRHQNLVSLYGCTSQHSRELLLVYEYVPNGTVADHLHGDRAKAALLTWPIRMSIAIESADALTYLHASEIIHRDVKTNNILLDNSFHVKVADFGLSRLFPTDVTHVSTAPQGTPGYVDPEYYQCYQLNNKSDVYSFGVVLIELISSKPAVDIGRHRHEINLANMAINRIQTRALNELVDPSLGFESDYNVRNMITLVAELAFRCLQQENEMRPSMVEVLETLRGIESEEYKKKMPDEMDISAAARLLKNSQPLSPDSVTDLWGSSKATTPNTSA